MISLYYLQLVILIGSEQENWHICSYCQKDAPTDNTHNTRVCILRNKSIIVPVFKAGTKTQVRQ